jgi:hypothetical protein
LCVADAEKQRVRTALPDCEDLCLGEEQEEEDEDE